MAACFSLRVWRWPIKCDQVWYARARPPRELSVLFPQWTSPSTPLTGESLGRSDSSRGTVDPASEAIRARQCEFLRLPPLTHITGLLCSALLRENSKEQRRPLHCHQNPKLAPLAKTIVGRGDLGWPVRQSCCRFGQTLSLSTFPWSLALIYDSMHSGQDLLFADCGPHIELPPLTSTLN